MKFIFTTAFLTMALTSHAATMKIKNTSKIGFEITKYKVAQVVAGSFKEFTGTVTVENNEMKTVNVTIQAKSIDTGSEKRDEHLRSGDFFDVSKEGNKTITFISNKKVAIAESFKLPGTLKMKGKEKNVTLDVKKIGENKFQGSTVINKDDFGLAWNRPLEKSAWESLKSSLKGFAGNIIGNMVTVKVNIDLN